MLRGTAYSDLPAKDNQIAYGSIKCPVLILSIKGDDAHPLSTALSIARNIPQSIVHIADNVEMAAKQWPHIVSTFLQEVNNERGSIF